MLGLITVLAVASACDSGSDRALRVSAASSLSEAFGEIESAFERENPDVDVVLNLAGSSLLREQILSGAPVDVFASASREIMEQISDAGLVSGRPSVFALNQIEIAVPPGNPAGVTGISDFARDELFLGLCEAQVPCGILARAALDAAGVVAAPDTNEQSVRSLLTKIEAGELDAGMVYATDVLAGEVEGIQLPAQYSTVAEYPMAALSGSSHPAAATAFVDFVLSSAGQAILARYGFISP